jgi:hypothetical protein
MCLYSIRYQCTSEIGENDLSISRTLTLSPAYYIGFINNLNILPNNFGEDITLYNSKDG